MGSTAAFVVDMLIVLHVLALCLTVIPLVMLSGQRSISSLLCPADVGLRLMAGFVPGFVLFAKSVPTIFYNDDGGI